MKKYLLIGFLFIQFNLSAQEAKPGCNPKACSPGNTKIEEAAVITNLRLETTKLVQTLSADNQYVVQAGKTEEESLELIRQQLNRLEKIQGRTETDFTKLSGAKLVQKLSEVAESLKQ